jgi:multicomponent K+:H+ antiporter subunit C
MEALIAVAIGALVGAGVYLLLRARTYPVILGIMLLGYGVNLFLVAMGRVGDGAPPIITAGTTDYVDPLPQALVLTAIVIGFGMAAFIVVLALVTGIRQETDHVDGEERL